MYKFLAFLVFMAAVIGGLWVMPEGKWAQLDETRSTIRAAAGEDYEWLLGSSQGMGRKSEANLAVATTDMTASEPQIDTSEVIEVAAVSSPEGRYVSGDEPAESAASGQSEPMYDIVRVGSPAGRYVDGPKMAAPAETMVEMADIVRVSSPGGRYVDAPVMVKKVRKIIRVASPAGRYVDAPVMAAKPPVMAEVIRVSSPAGRYVDAPPMITGAVETKDIVRVSSPPGRYVDGPVMKVEAAPMADIVRVSSPPGRYVDGPVMKVEAAPMADIVRVSSPPGRYVDGPVMKVEAAPMADIVRVSSPPGRYVDGPAVATTARKTETGALAFPIQFEFATSQFTPSGKAAVEDLLQYVKSRGFRRISLSGHTDSIGRKPDNLALSKQRLDAVEKYLRAGGYNGEIELLPKGESEPFTGIDRSKYTNRELREFDRRVELRSGQ